MNTPNMDTPSGAVTREKHRWVSLPHEQDWQRKERLRRRAGAAWARIQAGACEIAAALGKHHSLISQRTKGEGWFAQGILEIDALERWRPGSTDSLVEAILATQAEARQSVAPFCPKEFAHSEQALDSAEDSAGIAYLTGRGTAHGWADSMIAYAAHILRNVSALRREA